MSRQFKPQQLENSLYRIKCIMEQEEKTKYEITN